VVEPEHDEHDIDVGGDGLIVGSISGRPSHD